MLDRFPTELISLVIDASSSDAWQRKTLLDSLSSVSHSYRFAMRPLRESIVHVPKAAVIPTLRSWPAETRKAVVTVFVGPKEQAEALEPFSIQDFSRLFSIFSKIKHICLQRMGDSYYSKCDKRSHPCRLWFELNASNPFRECFSLSLRQSLWHFPPALEAARFKLRRLRLEVTLKAPGPGGDEGWGAGIEQFLSTRGLPCLRELRLSCSRIPAMSFLNQLHAVQVDHVDLADDEHSLGKLRQTDPDSTPVLISFHMGPGRSGYGRKFPGITFASVMTRMVWNLSTIIQMLPDLKALAFCAFSPYVSTYDGKSLDNPSFADAKKLIEEKSIELFAFGCNDDFVDRGFLDFLNSRGPRS